MRIAKAVKAKKRMTTDEPIDGKNHSDTILCPRCGTSLPLNTSFCGMCGRRIKEYEGEQARAKNGDEDALTDTVRVLSLTQAHWKSLQSDQSLNNNGTIGQTNKSSLQPLARETLTSEEVTTQSLPVPDIDTRQQEVISPSQHWEQQTTQPASIARGVYQQLVGMLGSNSSSTKRGSILFEDTRDAVSIKLTGDETAKLSTLSNNDSAITGLPSKRWGWLPILSLTSAIGVFLMALAYEGGRLSSHWSDLFFWLSLLALFIPITVRIFSSRPSRQERIALLIVLTVGCYFVQYLEYPLHFAAYDEFIHVRTEQDIAATGHLFHANPILPISSFYPGMEIATHALSSLTGLSPFVSGVLLIGLTRLLGVLAIYLFFEYLSKSPRTTAIGTLFYIMNPGFIFFDQMFAYESLAISLALFIVFAVACRRYVHAGHHRGLTLAIWLAFGAVVITHHVTSYVLVLVLLAWTVIAFVWKLFKKDQTGPGGIAFLGLILCTAWLFYTGNAVVDYLAPHFAGTLGQLQQILAGESAIGQSSHSSSTSAYPLWERVTSYMSLLLVGIGILFGLFQVWRHYRTNTTILVLAGAALVYPASQALRLTRIGSELASRSTEFLFVGVAFILAIGAMGFWLSRMHQHWKRSAIMIGAVVIVFVGQMSLGSGPPSARVPGPYQVSADNLSIEPESINAAKWASLYLGPGQRIATDRDNALLMATYGKQWVVTASNDQIGTSTLFTALQLGPNLKSILLEDRISYLVVDLRLSTGLPVTGTYFNGGEPDAFNYTSPINPAALTKYDGVKNVNRLFDSGNIAIYKVDGLVNGSSATPTPQPVCTLASSTASSTYPNVAKLYTGQLYDIPTGLTTNISLTGMQQQQGTICGSFGGTPAGPLKGTVTASGQIQFVVTSNNAGQTTFSFSGVLLPDGSMVGTYCSPGVGTGTCSDYGLWSVSAAQSG